MIKKELIWKFKEAYEQKFDEELSSEKAEEYLEDLVLLLKTINKKD